MERWEYLVLSTSQYPFVISLGPTATISNVDWLRRWLQDKCPKAVVDEPQPDKWVAESLVPYATYRVTGLSYFQLYPVFLGVISHLGDQGWEMVNFAISDKYTNPIPPDQYFWFKRRVTVQAEERREVLK